MKKVYIFLLIMLCFIVFPSEVKAFYLTNEECKAATNCSRDCSRESGSNPYTNYSCSGKSNGDSCGPGANGGFLQGGMGTCVDGTCWQTPPNYACTDNWSNPDVNRDDPNGQGSITPPSMSIPAPDLGEDLACNELLGESLTKIVKIAVDMVQIVGVIICIVNGMLAFIPAVIGKDDSELKKATKKLVTMLIVCAIIGLFPTIIAIIGNLFGFDLSCFS